MTREEYKSKLLEAEFKFDKTQLGYPGRGEEDVYVRYGFRFNFYVTRVSKDANIYGLVTGKTNGRRLENISPPNSSDSFAPDKGLYVWIDDAFENLIKHLANNRSLSKA